MGSSSWNDNREVLCMVRPSVKEKVGKMQAALADLNKMYKQHKPTSPPNILRGITKSKNQLKEKIKSEY